MIKEQDSSTEQSIWDVEAGINLKYIHIQNFKSIYDLNLEDCRRINLFIGYPNVGKSNVLEALGLFSLPYLNEGENLNKFIRVENKNELFFDTKMSSCHVTDDISTAEFRADSSFVIKHEHLGYEKQFFLSPKLNLTKRADSNINDDENYWRGNVKRYTFTANQNWISDNDLALLPPYGENLINVLSYNPNVAEVKAWMKKEFVKFGLEYVLDKTSNSLKIQRRLGNDEIFQLPYSSIADTLQRIIFYKTAIASNSDSVLLFEEPEAHAFPPYIKTITQDIIDSESNQFFIVTHSPVIVNAFMEYEKVRRETAIYLFDFKNNQTTVKRLTDKEMDEIYNYGEDLFFNLESFL
jgi:AAA15 family ATPase/GTPase